ncbi:MAG: ATP-dependent nuclease subunit B-like protein [Methanoculleus marisnigri]|uniref:ATP-dependent nuclease subunit B-like protein n=1 Tax=Methanoculleus marisnigri TaxID=2198 RepID=A0A124G5S4_9EURY|nr:MAG: ATP-dependent nuclease subunit B-like protein [Methanoculleus marisnigri]
MPRAVLYRHIPGAQLDEFIRQFRKAAVQDPLGTVFIVPTSYLVREIMHRLDEEGAPIVASAVTTLQGFAQKVFLDNATIETLISDAESRLILTDILTANAARFPLLAGVKTVDELATLFSVLIMRKINYPDALGDLQSGKSAEIEALFDAYLQFLKDHSLVDGSTLFAWATRQFIEMGARPRTVFIYGLFEPMPCERDLLLVLRDYVDEFHYALPFAENPAVFTDDGRWLHPDTVIAGERRSSLANLFSRREPGDSGGFIRIAERRDGLDEVRAIAQEICDLIAGGVRPGEIAVAFPDLDQAFLYVEEVFADFNLPYAASSGQALLRSPLTRAMLDVLTVPVFGYRREDVVALLSSPYIRFTWSTSEVDLLSREARIVAGAGTWDRRLAGLAATLEEEQAALDAPDYAQQRLAQKIARIETVREGIRCLFADLACLEGKKTLAEHLTTYRSLLARWHCPAMPEEGDPGVLEREARDLRAFVDLLEALERFTRVLPEQQMSLVEFSSLLGLLAAGTRSSRKRNRNAVQVVGVRELTHLSIPYLFLADLVEGVMPRLTTRLPFTTDLETRRLGTRSKADVLREERYYFIAALLAAHKRVYLSYPSADGGSPVIRSGFVDAVRETISTEPWGGSDFPSSRIAAARKAGALLARGEFARGVAGLPPGHTIGEAVRRLIIENECRKGAYDSPYDGLLTGEPAITATLAERYGAMAVFSPTALEMYADCPFRFYLARVLGLEPLPAVDLDLTALERGSLLHKIAFRFYAGWRGDGNGAITETSYPAALQQILAIGRDETARLLFDSPAWLVEKEHLVGSPHVGRGLLERFLSHEVETASSTFVPHAFELSFGLPVAAGTCDPASTPDAIAIPLGGTDGEVVRIRGRIDRVDCLPDGRFLIADYKTGSSHPSLKNIEAGKAFQLPLYLRAVETLTAMQGVAGCYYTLRRGKIRNQPVFWSASLKDQFKPFSVSSRSGVADVRALVDTSLAHVSRCLEGIRSGWFAPRSDPDSCPGYCDFKTVCRFNSLRLLAIEEVRDDGTD